MLSKNQIKELQSLHLKKFRDEKKLFVAEGVKTVLEIIARSPGLIKEVYGTRDFTEKQGTDSGKLAVPFTEVTETELQKISMQTSPNAALAVCRYFPETSAKFDFEKDFSLYLDDIRDPGNFGTILRLAAWFGISTVFCSPSSCDFYNPKVIQSTMGAFLRVKVQYTGLNELLQRFNVRRVYGAVLNGKNLYREKLGNGIIVIGNEANGISAENQTLLNQLITIPPHQNNGTESLNAAMATSIITSEFFRQLKIY